MLNDLNFIIDCKSLNCHYWMSFALWYSINKQFEDSRIHVHLPPEMSYRWPNKLGVKVNYHRLIEEDHIKYCFDKYGGKTIILKPDSLLVRSLSEDWQDYFFLKHVIGNITILSDITADPVHIDVCSLVKESRNTSFVSYGDGFHRFKTLRWIHSNKAPFVYGFKYAHDEGINDNEKLVFALWQRAFQTFQAVS